MSNVHFSEIDELLAQSVAKLGVSPEQRRHVAENARSLGEAQETVDAWPRAIMQGSVPVGFVMLFDPTVEAAKARGPIRMDQIGLRRFKIDSGYQSRGLVRDALCCRYARDRGCFKEITSSFVDGPNGPKAI